MRVRDLVAMADLHLVPLTGEDGFDRPIRWVYTTDLLDPGRYLSGGELVLTGMMWRRDPADADTFVAAAASRHVACVAAGDAAYGSIPDDLLAACRAHEVPLLEVPIDVSFATITERVIHRLTLERQGDLGEQLGRRRRLLAAVAEGAGLEALLRLWAEDTEVRCALLTATGRPPVEQPDVPSDEVRTLLAEEYLAARSFPHIVHCGDQRTFTVYPVEPRGGHRVTGWFVACSGDHREWPHGLRESVGELASLIGLERERWEDRSRAERVAAEQLFRLVLSGRSTPDEVADRLTEAGFAASPYTAVSVTVSPQPDGHLACQVLEEVLTAALPGSRVLAAAVDDDAFALVDAVASVAAPVRARMDALAPAAERRRLLCGMSLPGSGPAGLLAALSEARQARTLAELRPGAAAVLATDEIDSHALLLATVPDDVRRTFRARVLGPVLDYDERHGSDFVATLEAFLEASGSWTQCAQVLHLHVNTLRYRIQRIEDLTGRSLSRLEDRVDFFLALRAG